eukprot:706695-Rhodomonas_salina.1
MPPERFSFASHKQVGSAVSSARAIRCPESLHAYLEKQQVDSANCLPPKTKPNQTNLYLRRAICAGKVVSWLILQWVRSLAQRLTELCMAWVRQAAQRRAAQHGKHQ